MIIFIIDTVVVNGDLSDESQYFVDRQVENFEDFILFNRPSSGNSEVSRQKRSSFLEDAAQQQQGKFELPTLGDFFKYLASI